MSNIYVYDKKTGKISYSIDGATPAKIEAVQNRGMSFIVLPRCNVLTHYVVEEEGRAVRTELINEFHIDLNKAAIFADGEDTLEFSNIPEDTEVFVNGVHVWTSTSTDTVFEFTAEGWSPQSPTIEFKKYGFNSFKGNIKTLLPPNAKPTV